MNDKERITQLSRLLLSIKVEVNKSKDTLTRVNVNRIISDFIDISKLDTSKPSGISMCVWRDGSWCREGDSLGKDGNYEILNIPNCDEDEIQIYVDAHLTSRDEAIQG